MYLFNQLFNLLFKSSNKSNPKTALQKLIEIIMKSDTKKYQLEPKDLLIKYNELIFKNKKLSKPNHFKIHTVSDINNSSLDDDSSIKTIDTEMILENGKTLNVMPSHNTDSNDLFNLTEEYKKYVKKNNIDIEYYICKNYK